MINYPHFLNSEFGILNLELMLVSAWRKPSFVFSLFRDFSALSHSQFAKLKLQALPAGNVKYLVQTVCNSKLSQGTLCLGLRLSKVLSLEGNKKSPPLQRIVRQVMRANISRYHLNLLLSHGRSLFRYSKPARHDFGNTLALLRAHPLCLPIYVSDTVASADGT